MSIRSRNRFHIIQQYKEVSGNDRHIRKREMMLQYWGPMGQESFWRGLSIRAVAERERMTLEYLRLIGPMSIMDSFKALKSRFNYPLSFKTFCRQIDNFRRENKVYTVFHNPYRIIHVR